ncbi:AfsR/SARP family transcriptional regulator [Nocardia brevicatena]|uniref:AfsR/SARP family transcriptional regulator n=1 Tax=Nocardia brevicatena TaxID=37327 RepID=UPI00030FDB87|nr:BTAD domain-containing putative transcriptional regulator [Nocardia brevicatena]
MLSSDPGATVVPTGPASPPDASITVGILGEIAIRRATALHPVPGARARVLLTALAVRPGRSRGPHGLIDDIWGDRPPRSPMNALHTQVSRLRAALPDGALEIGPAGYRLTLGAEQVDLAHAQRRVQQARRVHAAGDTDRCLGLLAEARALWRGEPGADLPPGPVADELITAAADCRRALDELESAARETIGDLAGAVAAARRLATADPLNEPAHATLMRLLAQTGRGSEALEVFATLRIRLADELGTDPGPALIELNTALLRGEPIAALATVADVLPPLTADTLDSPATELFTARARAVRPSVHLNPDTVARLCRTLDGLPLAIELAAARVRTMSVADIESRLGRRFALLRGGDRSSPERHRTLHAVIEWSWNLLDEPQRIALRRLCRFPDGFTLSAAVMVAGGAEVVDAAAAIDGLVSQSLLTVSDEGDGIGVRYRMLETVREFGEERLVAVGEEGLVAHRMCRWARELARDAVRRYLTAAQVSVVPATLSELDNLLAVMRQAFDRRDADTVYTVFPVIGALWVMRGSPGEAGGLVRTAHRPPASARAGTDRRRSANPHRRAAHRSHHAHNRLGARFRRGT